MTNYPHPFFAREGWPFIAGAAAISVLVSIFAGWIWSAPCWIIALFCFTIFP